MSDTPRTDSGWEFDNQDPDSMMKFARQLERELNAAQATIRQQQLLDEEIMRLRERVKRLEEAGDKMANVLICSAAVNHKTSATASAWREAKEAKP